MSADLEAIRADLDRVAGYWQEAGLIPAPESAVARGFELLAEVEMLRNRLKNAPESTNAQNP